MLFVEGVPKTPFFSLNAQLPLISAQRKRVRENRVRGREREVEGEVEGEEEGERKRESPTYRVNV